jgi:hypothetical protein
MNTTLDDKLFAELAYRENDGIEVSLLWNRADDSVSVVVTDARNEEAFEFAAAPEAALDAFEHPFAYAPAAERGACATPAHRRNRQGASSS